MGGQRSPKRALEDDAKSYHVQEGGFNSGEVNKPSGDAFMMS